MEIEATPVPGRWCHWVSNSDHWPLCKGAADNSCLNCPRYLDGDTDLLPWSEPWTEKQKSLKVISREIGKLYESMTPIYKKIWALADQKYILLGEVKRKQGRC